MMIENIDNFDVGGGASNAENNVNVWHFFIDKSCFWLRLARNFALQKFLRNTRWSFLTQRRWNWNRKQLTNAPIIYHCCQKHAKGTSSPSSASFYAFFHFIMHFLRMFIWRKIVGVFNSSQDVAWSWRISRKRIKKSIE